MSTTYALSDTEPVVPRRGCDLAQCPLDLPGLVDLHRVALLHVGVVGQHDAALKARQHLAHVVVEAPQRTDLAVVDHGTVADQADLGAARDLAVGDHAARDHTHARRAEDLADLDVADDVLDGLGRQQTLHGVAQFVDRAVDDGVRADLDALAVGQRPRAAHRAYVEAHDDRVGGRGQVDVGLGDAADTGQHDRDLHLFLGQL